MPNESNAIVFDIDAASMESLREALPGWQLQDRSIFANGNLTTSRNLSQADLLVVGVQGSYLETLALCRYLAFCSTCSNEALRQGDRTVTKQAAPLLVLVPPGHEDLIGPVLKAGAFSCLMLPIHAKQVASMLVRAYAGNQPGRHTVNLERAQAEDRWRDTGGEG